MLAASHCLERSKCSSNYIKIFTFLSKAKVEALIKEHNIDKSKRLLQNQIAEIVTIMVHSKKDLNNYANFERKSTLELHEDIEILRFLDIGTTVRLIETQKGSLAVDIPSDVARVESEILKN